MGASGFNRNVLIIIAAAVLLSLAALIVSVVLLVKINNQYATTTPTLPPPTASPTKNPPVSNSPGFKSVAKMFAQSIDLSVDPCQDFYQFSCGNWIRSHPIPPGYGSAISFGVLQNQITKTVTNIFTANANNSIPPISHSAVQKAQILWNSCMSRHPGNYNGSMIVGRLAAYGGWPMISPSWSKMTYSLGFLMGHFAGLFGVDTFLPVWTDTNWKSPTSGYMLFVDQASLSFPLTYYTTPAIWSKTKPAFIKYITSTAALLAKDTNVPFNATQATNDATEMASMEYIIAATMAVPVAQQRDASKQYNPYNFKSISGNSAWNVINWNDFFTQLGITNGVVSSTFLKGTTFSLVEPTFLNKFTQWLKTKQASQRLLQNYMMWRVMGPQLQFLSGAYKDAYAEYQRDVYGIEQMASNGDHCSGTTLGYMGYATSRLYVQNYWNKLPGNPRAALSSMIDTVKTAFGGMVNQLPWMDNPTKASAQAKIVNLVKNVAYPDWMMNDTLLNQYYNPYAISPQDSFMLLLYKATRFSVWNTFNKLTLKSTDRRNFNGAPAIVNAWYQPELNSISFPAGILNPPFFSPQFPRSVNYGGMGVVMGHELTHGFDDQGVQWNGTGFLNPWIDTSSMKGFHNMAQCVIDEYSGFCYNTSLNLHPNCISGQRTQGENIADNGGIKAAWSAYQTLNEQNGVEPRLPGAMSQFSHDQLFFMSFAQVWCRNVKMSSVQRQLLTDPHSPAKYRVFGTVQNVPQQFSKGIIQK